MLLNTGCGNRKNIIALFFKEYNTYDIYQINAFHQKAGISDPCYKTGISHKLASPAVCSQRGV